MCVLYTCRIILFKYTNITVLFIGIWKAELEKQLEKAKEYSSAHEIEKTDMFYKLEQSSTLLMASRAMYFFGQINGLRKSQRGAIELMIDGKFHIIRDTASTFLPAIHNNGSVEM